MSFGYNEVEPKGPETARINAVECGFRWTGIPDELGHLRSQVKVSKIAAVSRVLPDYEE